MNNEGLNRTSNVFVDPTRDLKSPPRVNVDVLKQRLIEQKRDKVRYKYGQKLDFSFDKGFSPYKQQIGFKLNFNFG